MSRMSFPSSTKEYFEYLIREYSFSITEETCDSKPFGDGLIEFQSAHASVSIQLDRGAVLVDIGSVSEPEISRVSIETLAEYLSHGEMKLSITQTELPYGFEEKIRSCFATILRASVAG